MKIILYPQKTRSNCFDTLTVVQIIHTSGSILKGRIWLQKINDLLLKLGNMVNIGVIPLFRGGKRGFVILPAAIKLLNVFQPDISISWFQIYPKPQQSKPFNS